MTKSKEKGENEVTEEAKREAIRQGKHVCDILAAMLKKAKKEKDKARMQKIRKAQKYLKCRNIQKREDNQ